MARGSLNALQVRGFAVIERLLDGATTYSLVSAIEEHQGTQLRDSAGARNLHRAVPPIAALMERPEIAELIQKILPGAFAVRSIFFDKTPDTNWKVPWHQDLSICVRERVDTEGFGAWSVKEGVFHVQPPIRILERMVTLRIHLDDCGEDNGPLLALPGSHRQGRFSAEDIARWRKDGGPEACIVRRGGVVVMKPLLLHASSAAERPSHRRVVHIEYTAEALPNGLQWLE